MLLYAISCLLLCTGLIYGEELTLLASGSKKKGMYGGNFAGDLNAVNANWYYHGHWSTLPEPRFDVYGVPFVPIVKNKLVDLTFPSPPEVLLGYEEPDVVGGQGGVGFLTPAEALALWPQVEATKATRLGSPSPSSDNLLAWTGAFLAGNGNYKPKVDFVTVRWFGKSAATFLAFLDDAHDKLKLPIWVTAFGFVDRAASDSKPSSYTPQDAINFLKEAIPGLESRAYIERYAYFSDPSNAQFKPFSVWTTDRQVTEVGRAYAAIDSLPPTTDPTSSPSTPKPSSLPPTSRPTIQPSTLQPTSLPPTTRPSTRPSTQPSTQPSSALTNKPSNKPSYSPSTKPSTSPSLKPYTAPTAQPTSRPFGSSKKKGIAVVRSTGNLKEINAYWYYKYHQIFAEQNPLYYGSQFVPIAQKKSQTLNFPSPPDFLLGYNEPDLNDSPGQYMTPAEALREWPNMEATKAKRLGSPSTADRNLLKWTPEFLAGNATYKPRVDFVTVHWYGRDANEFLAFLDTAHAKFNLPLWVTEFGFVDWSASASNPTRFTAQDAITFLKVAIPGLEKRAYLERYAYYSDPDVPQFKNFALHDNNRQLTDVGKAYAAL